MYTNRSGKFIILFIFIIVPLILSAYSKEIIGNSVSNRNIEIYKFGNGKNLIVIVAGIHGNESNTTRTAYDLIDLLKQKKIIIPFDKSIWIIPEANPDGLIRDRRLNDNNIDLNRNFGTDDWQPKFYFFNILLSAGNKPFSEPETLALKILFENLDKNINPIVLSLHSRGNIIIPGNGSFGNKELVKFIYKNSSYDTGDIGYKSTGDLTSWLSDNLNIPSVTIEFKTKENKETNEIKKILTSLLRLDLNKSFINKGIKFEQIPKQYVDNIENLLHGLPLKIKKSILANEDSKKDFVNHFNHLRIDEELLLLVNKKIKLPEEYEPDDLVNISDNFPTDKKDLQLRMLIIPFLERMFEDARSESINLKIISGYRSYDTQKNVFNYWSNKLGEEEAKMVSAHPGCSQHQLGTTIDFNSLNMDFGKTKEGKWLYKNSYKYGFILSFPPGQEDLTGFKYEPWHFRFIGIDAAYLVYNYFDNLLEIFLRWYWEKKIEQ